MTVELFDHAPPDVETLVVAWLAPLGSAAVERKTNAPLPFRLVSAVAASEDADLEVGEWVVSVHTLCARSQGRVAARDEAADTHRRMLALDRWRETIELADGDDGWVDYCNVVEPQMWQPYGDDQILRKVGRYAIGLSYLPVDAGSS